MVVGDSNLGSLGFRLLLAILVLIVQGLGFRCLLAVLILVVRGSRFRVSVL